jgi:hypothetical protein
VGILYPTGATRRGVQNPEKGLGDPPDPSSEVKMDRSAYLRGLPGLCPARDAASAFALSGDGINPSRCPGKIWLTADDRSPSSDHGRPQGSHVPVHPARAGTPNVTKAVTVIVTQSAPAPCDGWQPSA